MEEKEDRAFTVHDRRFASPKPTGDSNEKNGSQTSNNNIKEQKNENDSAQFKLPEANLMTLILSISTSAYMHMGQMANPEDGEKPGINLPMAKHSIDLISMLKEKTKGNTSEEEAKMIEELLYSLKIKYVELSSKN